MPAVGGRRRKVGCNASWTIANGTGAPTAIDTDDPGITLARTGVGAFTLSHPASFGQTHVDIVMVDGGTRNVFSTAILTQVANTGVVTLILQNAANPPVATENTSAALVLRIEFTLDIS